MGFGDVPEDVFAAELVVVAIKVVFELFFLQGVKDEGVALIAFLYYELNV